MQVTTPFNASFCDQLLLSNTKQLSAGRGICGPREVTICIIASQEDMRELRVADNAGGVD